MTFSTNTGNVLGQSGNSLPVRDRLAAVLRDKPAKVLARITGRTPKAAERWKLADNAMTVDALFALAREIPEVWDIVKQECGRANTVTEAEQMLARMRELLAGNNA